MRNDHPSDQVIQEFIWNPEAITVPETNHISGCGHCKLRLANYRLLFTQIEQLPEPTFDFDLSTAVLSNIAEQSLAAGLHSPPSTVSLSRSEKAVTGKNKSIWAGMLIILMGAFLIGIPAYLFQDSLLDIVADLSTMITYLIVMTVVLIATFLVIDEYRKYNQQINNLDI